MATNLVSVVMQFLTPDMIAKIASALGLDRSVAQKAIAGAVPALLASLADLASAPNGARQLGNALAQQQAGSLESIKSIIGGSGQNTLAEAGSSVLSGLFGGGTLDTMAQSIGKFAGLDGASSKSLLGMLAPVVLGTLGQQQRSAGLDAGGLASLLGAQKDQIAAAIPSGLADQLSAAGLIDRAAGTLRSGTAAASAAGNRIAGASERTVAGAGQAARATTSAASSQWPYWLVALAVLGGLAWYTLGPRTVDNVAELPRPATTQPADRNRGRSSVKSDDWRSESGEPGQLVRRHLEISAGNDHGRRFRRGGRAQASRSDNAIERSRQPRDEAHSRREKRSCQVDRGSNADHQPDVRQGAGDSRSWRYCETGDR